MKLTNILPLAALSTAFIIPDEQVTDQIAIQSHRDHAESVFDKLPFKDEAINEFENSFSKLVDISKSAFDQAVDYASENGEEAYQRILETAFDAKSWLDTAANSVEDVGKHGKHGHHGHCKKPNMTVYVSSSLFILQKFLRY